MHRTLWLAALLTVACGGKDIEGMNPGECTNGIDEDGNGLIDCADPTCMASPDCEDAGGDSDLQEVGDTTDTGGVSGGDAGSGDSGSGTSGDGGDTSGGTGDDSSGGDEGGEGSAGDTSGTGDDGTTVDGESLYNDFCSGCHGMSGEGASGPGLEGEVSRHTDEELIAVILEGDGSMPPTDVTEAEAQAIVDYMRLMFGG